ncbi:MAG: ATP-dependent helicase [Actinomycetota bacterium]|nr:ATP-dependent helicase [Actinomycetota bacterium]
MTGEQTERAHSRPAGVRATLDEQQRSAVAAPPGSLLILAGAGSGKTRVLTERAAALARHPELGARAVLVITFTNRAAQELRERLAALIGTAACEQMTVGTFHAVCHRMLRSHAARVGRTAGFSVYDAAAQHKLIAAALEAGEGTEDLTPALVANQIGQAKARLLGAGDYRALARSERARAVAAAFAHYERALERCDSLDFDDLLAGAVSLLGEADLLAHYRRRWRALLVDEFQDTNLAQLELLRRLSARQANLSVVGDDDQAVYGFRGAAVANLLGFDGDFPGTRVIALERNYRSSGAIVASAARLVSHNAERREKTMWTPAPAGVAVASVACADEAEEAELAAGWACALLERGVAPGELAVLFRTRAQARAVEDALLSAGVPCRLLGGQGLWESAVVRDLLAHLTLLVNPRDALALARALRLVPGLGALAVASVLGAGEGHGGDLLAACVGAAQIGGLRGAQVLAVEGFGRRLSELAEALPQRGVAATVSQTVVTLGLAERLRAERSERAEEALERLRRFCRAAQRWEAEAAEPTLADFLAHAALAGGEDEAAGAQVTLATLHAAKGAEWDHVRLIGLCEGLLPHRRALAGGGLEEERRLAYVGMTRARCELVLSWPRRLGGRATQMSRFLAEAGLALASSSSGAGQDARRAA